MSGLVVPPLDKGAPVAIVYHEDMTSAYLGGLCDRVTIEVPAGEGLTVATSIKRFLRVEVTP